MADSLCFIFIGFWNDRCKNTTFKKSQAHPPSPKRRDDVFRSKIDLQKAPY